MALQKNYSHKAILIIIGISTLTMGVLLFIIPPALFPDPGMGFQVLRCMQHGGGFNNFVSPDQSDISQTYTEFLTWWSPGQYLVPYFFKLITAINTGQAIAVTVTIAQISGLAGFYCFYKKMGFSPLIAAVSLIFIFCQQAFVVPYVYYNGGEVLLFAFEGWFLYGCASLKTLDVKLLLFVFLSGLIGFFCKSSFIWIYVAGLCCLWARLTGNWEWVKKGLWIGIPAALSLGCIYLFFLSHGESPASAAHGFKLAKETLTFPLASPLLSAFSIDDLAHGLIYHTGQPLFNMGWSEAVLITLALISIVIIFFILQNTDDSSYRTFITVFYAAAILFFGYCYLRRLNISYEARHFRILGLLIVPGIIYLVTKFKPIYKVLFLLVFAGITYVSFSYLIKGYQINNVNARGVTGIAQPNIDQASLNKISKLDAQNQNATFVFIGNDIGLEIQHNRIINLQPIGDNLKINADDYKYQGFAGQLYIVLPESYNGPKEKMIMKSFPGYAGFNLSMLSDNYVLYSASMKRQTQAKSNK